VKRATTLLAAGLLLMAAVAVHAAEPQAAPDLSVTPQLQVEPTTLVGDSVLASLGTGCGNEASPTLAVGLPGAITTGTQYCGSCSTSNCRGAARGQICSLGGGGFGHCNIFSGGYMCSDGSGWECQCEGGVLP